MNYFYAWLNRRSFRQLGIIVSLLGAAIAVAWLIASWAFWVPGFPTDDGLVYASLSRNLADGYGYGINPGQAGGPADGPLWARFVAFGQLFGLNAWFASVFCGFLAMVVLSWAMVRLTRRVSERRNYGWLAVVLVLVHPWSSGLWVRGDEQVLAAAFLFLALWLQYRRPDPPPQRSAWISTFSAALAVTLRPEFWLIPLLLIIDDLVRKYATPRKPNWVFSLMPRLAVHLILYLGPLALYCVFHFFHGRHPFPQSLTSGFSGPGIPALALGAVPLNRWGETLLIGLLFPLYMIMGLVLSAPFLVPLWAGGFVQFLRKRSSLFPLFALCLPVVIQGWLYPWSSIAATDGWLRYGGLIAVLYLWMSGAGICRLFPMRAQRRKWFDRAVWAIVGSCLVVFLAETAFRFLAWRPEGLRLWNPGQAWFPAGVPIWWIGLSIILAAGSAWWSMQRTGTTRLVQSMLFLMGMLWAVLLTVFFAIPSHRRAVAELNLGPRLAGAYIGLNIQDILATTGNIRPTIATDMPGCIAYDADLPVLDMRPRLQTPKETGQFVDFLRRSGERGPALLFYKQAGYPALEDLLAEEVVTRRVSGLPQSVVDQGRILLRLQQWQPHRPIEDSSIGIVEETEGLLE